MNLLPDKGEVYVNKDTGREYQQREVTAVINEVDKLESLIGKTNNIIYEISSTFPFQLFPDRIVVDENKITIIRKNLFFKRIFPIMYEDLLTVRITRGIIFASMEIEVRRLYRRPRPIEYLNPQKASMAKKYIMGLVEAKKANIDLSMLPINQIRTRLEEIGKADEEIENLF